MSEKSLKLQAEEARFAEHLAAEKYRAEYSAADSRIDFDNGNYAIREAGLIKFYLKDDRELFGVDANTIPFERKLLTAVMQVYLLGFNHGRSQEKAGLKTKLATIITLVFE